MTVLDDWLLTAWRAAIHLPTRTAVVADLHLGYDRVRRRNGEAVPVRPLRDVLRPVESGMRDSSTRRLLIAGDLFEDARAGREGVIDELLEWVSAAGVELVGVVPGNHDRGLVEADRLPLLARDVALGRWHVVHGDGVRPGGPVVQGHEHPWLRWRPGVEGPCYLVGEGHLVLPAYSTDAAGVNVLGKKQWAGYRCCAIAAGRVLDFGEVARR